MVNAVPVDVIASTNPWWNTLIFGLSLSLMSLGLALTYSVSKVSNFAHGEYAVAGIVAYTLVTLIISGSLTSDTLMAAFGPENPSVASYTYLRILAAFLFGGAVALASLMLVFRPLRIRGATPLQLMVASIGLELMLKSIWYIWYYTILGGTNVIASIARIPIGEGVVNGVNIVWTIPASALLTIVISVFIFAMLVVFFTKAMIGVSMRAVADNPELAEATGINTMLIEALAWFIGGGLTAVGGLLWYLWQGSSMPLPELGWTVLAFVFASVTLGGLSNLVATAISSFLISAAFNIVTMIVVNAGLATGLAYAVPPAVVITTLLIAPRGIAPYVERIMTVLEEAWKKKRYGAL